MSELNDERRQEILNAIQNNRKIEAVKLYREVTGVGLKDSKEFIEELTEQLLRENPNAIQYSSADSSSAGCGASVIVLCASVLGILWWQFA